MLLIILVWGSLGGVSLSSNQFNTAKQDIWSSSGTDKKNNQLDLRTSEGQSITINLSGIYRICAEQQTLRKGYPTCVQRSVPEVAITFPAVDSHPERPRPEKDSCQSFSSNSCSRVPRLRMMGWARVVKSRRRTSVPTAGLLDFHTPKKELCCPEVRRGFRAFRPFFHPPGFSFFLDPVRSADRFWFWTFCQRKTSLQVTAT